MNITITINTDNAAFEDNPSELRDIFRRMATYWGAYHPEVEDSSPIKDSNGNTIGEIVVTE